MRRQVETRAPGQYGRKGFSKPTRTIVSEAYETDINAIVKKYRRTGQVTHLASKVPRYGDFSARYELADAMNQVMQAEEEFMSLPPEVRLVAENDPVKFLELLATEEGTAELVAAGLDPDIEREEEVVADAPGEESPAPSGEATPDQ